MRRRNNDEERIAQKVSLTRFFGLDLVAGLSNPCRNVERYRFTHHASRIPLHPSTITRPSSVAFGTWDSSIGGIFGFEFRGQKVFRFGRTASQPFMPQFSDWTTQTMRCFGKRHGSCSKGRVHRLFPKPLALWEVQAATVFVFVVFAECHLNGLLVLLPLFSSRFTSLLARSRNHIGMQAHYDSILFPNFLAGPRVD